MDKKSINFENEPMGIYTEEQINKAWGNPLRLKGVKEKRCTISKNENKKVLKVKFPNGAVGLNEGGAQWKYKFDKNYNEIYAQYKLMFPKGFNFVRGGKLPGLTGGSSPTGGKKCVGDGFSARVMWRVKGFVNNKIKDPHKAYLCQYIYYPGKDPKKNWGEDFNWQNKKKEKIYIQPGKWHILKTRVRMNTPEKKYGLIESWFDGKKVLKLKIILRDKEYKFGIDSFNFVTFFGGNDSTWAPVKDEYIYFDDFIISSKDPKNLK